MKNDSQNHSRWQLKTKTLVISQTPLIMGIVNATPDSFSDGGNYRDPEDAIAHGLRLAAEGADIIDIGGESTRPYSEPVSAEQEIERVVRVVQGIAAKTDVPISIDTSKAVVATAGRRRLCDAHARHSSDDARQSTIRKCRSRSVGVS